MLAFLTLDKHTCKIPGGTSGGQTLWMFVSVSRFLSGMRRLARRRRVWFRNFDHHEVLRWITVGSECCSAYLFTCARGSYKKPAYGACKRPLVQPMTQRDKACWSTPPAACGRCRLPSSLNADLDIACDSGARYACAPAAGSLTMRPPLRRMPLRCPVFLPSRGACPARALAWHVAVYGRDVVSGCGSWTPWCARCSAYSRCRISSPASGPPACWSSPPSRSVPQSITAKPKVRNRAPTVVLASASSAETKATRLAPWTSPPASKLATSMWLMALTTFAPGANCATN